jgi:hypothetical protein
MPATATTGEVKKFIREKIEEKKKKIRKPEIVSHAYVDRILAELDIGRRKELAKEYEKKKKNET